MKISAVILAFALLFCLSGVDAQLKQTAGVLHFQSINTIGLVDGQGGGALQALTINGLRYRGWFWGIGAGIDGYRLRSIPVFADVRKIITHNFFTYADGGTNWYWHKAGDVKQFSTNDQFKTGFYGEAGLGYPVRLHRGLSLLFSGGYSIKELTETGNSYWYGTTYYAITGAESSSARTIHYHFNRIAIKAGIAF